MRCNPNDVVVVVRSKAGNLGRIGTVLRWAETGTVQYGHNKHGRTLFNGQAGWVVQGTFSTTQGETVSPGVFPDEWLRPLRDSEGDDETITWAGKPEQLETIE